MTTKKQPDQEFHQLLRSLSVSGPATATDARSRLGISQPAFSRLVRRFKEHILVIGRARSTRYAACRDIPLVGKSVPVYEVAESGETRLLATLHPIHPQSFYLETRTIDLQGQLFDDLPYFLHDLRPAGYLGRLIPDRHPELELPPDVRLWNADDCLVYLTRYGWNHSGNLILGEVAFRLYLACMQTPVDLVENRERERRYPEIAEDVLQTGIPGSSAAGEQPKFLVTRTPGLTAVLVKFSPQVRDQIGQRLADLLICENVAHQVIESHGQIAAKSELVHTGNRVFLEVERFDRIVGEGRRGLISLAALDAEFVGRMVSWSDTATELARQGQINQDDLRHIRWLECFGRLIANTDMHHGNLSFFASGTRITRLAPTYDMTPMLYAPHQGHLLERSFAPPLPRPSEADIWTAARQAASDFWLRVSDHQLVSDDFRQIARSNLSEIGSLTGIEHRLPR